MDLASFHQLDNHLAWETETYGSLYNDPVSVMKQEVKMDDSQTQYGYDSGAESTHTLTNLDDKCITGNANALLTTGDDSGFADRYNWSDAKNPSDWDVWQVQDWLKQFKNVQLNNFMLDGNTLCRMTLEHFMDCDPDNGGALYNELQQLLYPQMCSYVQQTYLPNFPTNIEGEEALDSFGRLCQAYSVDGTESLPVVTATQPVEVKATCKLEKTDCEEYMSPPPSPAESDISAVSSSKRGGRRNSRGKGKLWEFIRDLLLNSETCPSIIKWENRSEGIFRIVKSDEVAKRWGVRKSNKSMTYEKMSRAMRYYYKKGVLERIECRRLVYKFGSSSRGWQL